MSTRLKLIITIGLLLALTGGAYLYGVFYFKGHYFPGSRVNGYNCSYMTVEETEALMNREAAAFVLAVETQGDGREAITAEQVELSYHSDGTIQRQMDAQKRFIWFLEFNGKHNYDLSRSLSYNRGKLTEAVSQLKCISDPEQLPPQNATLYVQADGTYGIWPEQIGNTLDFKKTEETIAQAMLSGKVTVNLEQEGCYLRPSVYSTDPLLVSNCDRMNQLTQVVITYDFGDQTQRVDRDVIATWIAQDGAGNVVLDRNQVYSYVQALANTYDSVGGTRSFTTYQGEEIEINGGDFGWKIDVEQETNILYDAILNGDTQVREPAYLIRGYTRQGNNDIGYTYVEICTANQRIIYYDFGKPMIEADCVTGSGLPVGVFRAGKRQSPYHLTSGFKYMVPLSETFSDGGSYIDYTNVSMTAEGVLVGADIAYWMPFANVGISEGVARTTYGYEAYLTQPTMGNVEVTPEVAASLYSIFAEGTPVVVY